VTFFLESTFVAVWIFGWKRLSAKAHCLAIWLVAIASNLSAFWILVANAWMKHPVGYALRNGRAELTDFAAVVLQRTAITTVAHTLLGAYILAAFFVMGIAAWHLLRRQKVDFFGRSFKLAATFALLASVAEVLEGHHSAVDVYNTRPVALAAMEAHWETTARAPFPILVWPDEANERNSIEALSIPAGLSLMTEYRPDAVIRGLKDWPPEERPPVLVTFISFRIMAFLGVYFAAVALFAFWKRNSISDYRWFLKIAVWSIPLPYLANQMGWIVTEVGRQPWIMYGVMKTRDAVSTNLDVSQVVVSLAGFVVLYTLLGIVDFYLLAKYARQGPKEA
jgi:cytochrome d ubiquinol oxidase subunit I